MKKKAITILATTLLLSPYAGAEPSERLLYAALTEHFTRHYCESTFPQFKITIQTAYRTSRLRFVEVACREFTCSNLKHSNGMQTLLKHARELPESESLEACSSYPETLKSIENEFDVELSAISSTSRRP